MKAIIYTDEDGHQLRSYVKNDDEAHMGECGVPAGPPDVRQIDTDELLREINRVLVSAELFTWDDVQRSRIGLTPAINVLKRTLVNLYRQA